MRTCRLGAHKEQLSEKMSSVICHLCESMCACLKVCYANLQFTSVSECRGVCVCVRSHVYVNDVLSLTVEVSVLRQN